MAFDPAGPIVVFAGPSLPPPFRRRHPALCWRPPAVAGDAYALDSAPLAAVVLIDGLFDESPAIRHKELLTLMSRGVPLFGAASMGALRAAELHAFGMIGVGHIFAAFRTGRLDADDEVALVHGPASFGWTALTEPLVNVRATLLNAVRRGVFDPFDARIVLNAAGGMFYKHRTWSSVLESDTVARWVEPERIEIFRTWLPTGYVDLKRADAITCVETALAHQAEPADRTAPPDTMFSAVLADQVAAGLRPSAGYS